MPYQRPAAGYQSTSTTVNSTKYQDDASASPKRAVSSSKVDGDLNYLIDAVNALEDAGLSGALPGQAGNAGKVISTDGTTATWQNVTSTNLDATGVSAGSYSVSNITVDAKGRLTAASSGTVGTAQIANGSVTTIKIADANVTTAKIADNNVTFAKLPNLSSNVLLGSNGSGAAGEVSIGNGLALSGSVLSSSRNMVAFTSSGTFTPPAGVTSVRVKVWGAGGGGGSATTTGSNHGGGGGGGGYSEAYVTVTPGVGVPVTIGAGGAAASSGGTSSFGAVSATGGAGGTTATNNNTYFAGGSGGSGSGGIFNLTGGTGEAGVANGTTGTYRGGWGAHAAGGGGSGGNDSAGIFASSYNGGAGVAPGGGGGGAYKQATDATGGTGGNGLVVVYY